MPHQQLLDDLIEDLTKGTALLVAGTGVSIQASGGQPCASWDGLILDGIEHCVQTNLLSPAEAKPLRAQLKKRDVGKMIDVAERVSETLGAPEGGEFRLWLQRSVGALDLRHREIIDAIHDLGVPIGTTNYDDFLTRGRGIEAVSWTYGPAAHEIIRGDRHGVLHFHGNYDDPQSVVLGVRSYQKLLESRGAQAIQQAVVANRTLLFVGCGDGLTDPNFGALLEWSAQLFGGSIYRHYCLCRTSELKTLQKRFASDTRLFFIEYGKNYADLVPFLRDTLGAEVKSRRPGHFAALPPAGYCIGREREIEEVVSAILEDRPRPLPLLGGPGMGKTTIALAALHDKRIATRFGARRWFVRCDGVKSRAELAAAIATTLGLQISPAVEEAVKTSLAGGPGVLVVDNAETPLDADESDVEKLLAIIAAIESLALIVTIRGQKRPRGVPWRTSLEAARLTESAAREVFVEVSGKSKFVQDPYLDRLLGALDGVAIAITLMARYAEVFDFLEPVWLEWNRKRTAMLQDGENHTRETDIAVSYELSIGVLSAAGRRLLTVLAMLPNGVALIDLETVFDGSEEPARELRRRALAFEEGKRFRMLAPLREYVAATYPPDTLDAQPAIDHYLGLAMHEGDKVGSDGGAEAVARLTPEVANVESILAQNTVTTLASVAKAVPGWAELMRFTGLGSMSLIEEMATRTLGAGMTNEAAACILGLGNIALDRSDHEAALKHFEEALELYQRVGDLLGEANCIECLGDLAFERSDHEMARKQYEEALQLYKKVGSLLGNANCIWSLGDIALEGLDHEAARKRYEEARQLYQRVGDLLGEANCIWRLGDIALANSDHETGRKQYEAALPLYRKIGSLLGEANCIQGLGEIALDRPDHDTARKHFGEALQLYQRVGYLNGEANCIQGLGDIALRVGARDEAGKRYLAALELYERFPEPYSIGGTRRRLARLASEEEGRRAHVSAARAAWRSIGRDDLLESLDAEFGTE
jgi:tetratricopeptide (TPR) repeat protein